MFRIDTTGNSELDAVHRGKGRIVKLGGFDFGVLTQSVCWSTFARGRSRQQAIWNLCPLRANTSTRCCCPNGRWIVEAAVDITADRMAEAGR
jgi:hypothetical protein